MNEASSWHAGVHDTGIQATATLSLISTRAINDAAGVHRYLTETYNSLFLTWILLVCYVQGIAPGKTFQKELHPAPTDPHDNPSSIKQTLLPVNNKINTKSITVVRDHLHLNNTVVCTESKVINNPRIIEWFISNYIITINYCRR